MSNDKGKRNSGHYWAKRQEEANNEVVFIDSQGRIWMGAGMYTPYFFHWISEQSIEEEILGLKYKADTLSDMIEDYKKKMTLMENELREFCMKK